MDEDLDEYLRERDALRDEDGSKVKITDDDDLWPVLMPFEEAHPIYATFRVRPTAKDGGGYEIWDPQTQVALSSANPDWYFGDEATDRGMAECRVAGGECDGHQLVNFEPKLPHKATPLVERDILYEHGVLHWWQAGLIWLFIVAIVRLHFESWYDCAVCMGLFFVWFFAVLMTATVFLWGCGNYCKRHPETAGLFTLVIICGCVCLPFCVIPCVNRVKTQNDIVEQVEENP